MIIINLGLISPQIYPCKIGGVEIFNHEFVKEISKKIEKVYLFTSCECSFKNKNVNIVNLCSNLFGTNLLTTYSKLIYTLMKYSKNIDVLHIPYTSNSELAYPTLFTNKIIGIPYLINIRGGGMYEWEHKFWQKRFFENASKITSVSEAIKREYEKRINGDIKIIPARLPFRKSNKSKNYIRSEYGLEPSDNIILFVGSIKELKGCDTLLSAFTMLKKEFINQKNLKLVFVGDGPMKNKLEIKVKSMGFNQHVYFFGQIPYEKIPEMYKMSDFYVMPSLFEGNPNSLREALYNGLPVVGSDTRGINEIINHGENGLLFEVNNSTDLKNKLIELVKNVEEFSINYREKPTFEEIVDQYINIYSNLLK